MIILLWNSFLVVSSEKHYIVIASKQKKIFRKYLSILINYIIPYFYTNVKNRLYHLCDTLVSDLFFPCFIPLYQGSSPVGRCLSSDRLQV